MRAYRRLSQHDAPRDAMSAESTGLGAIELEPLVSLPPVPEGPEPPVPEGPEGIAEFWINMAREEILAIKEEHKNSSERKDAIIDVLRKELEAVRASALHWQTMYTSKAPKELEELKKHVAQAEAAGAGRAAHAYDPPTTTKSRGAPSSAAHAPGELRARVPPPRTRHRTGELASPSACGERPDATTC